MNVRGIIESGIDMMGKLVSPIQLSTEEGQSISKVPPGPEKNSNREIQLVPTIMKIIIKMRVFLPRTPVSRILMQFLKKHSF